MIIQGNSSIDIVSIKDFIITIEYLEERELVGAIRTTLPHSADGYLKISYDGTARLFKHLTHLVFGATLEVECSDGLLIVAATAANGEIPLRIAAKIAKTAFLSGFSANLDGGRLLLATPILRSRELSVYAPIKTTLIKVFKAYFDF